MARIERHRRWSVRVGVWLLGLAVVPLSGAFLFAYGEVQAVAESRQQVADIHRTTDELVMLSELRSRLLDERNWWSAVAGIEDLGIDAAVAEEFTGIDIVDELARSRSRVDLLLDAVDLPAVRAEVDELRSSVDPDLFEIADRMLALEQAVAVVAEGNITQLATVVGEAGDAAELNGAIRLLERAVEARQAVASEFSSYWGLLYRPNGSMQREFETLVEQGSRREDAVAAIMSQAPGDSAARIVLQRLALAPEKRVFDEAIRNAVDRTLEDFGRPVSFTNVLDDLDQIAITFQAGIDVTDAHLDLVEAAGDDVATATRALDASTDARIRRAAVTVAVLVAATLGFAGAVAAIIGRPLKRLADSAARLSGGDTDVRAEPVGPTEVRQATAALNEAVDQLALAERQATAMAEGRFDDPALHEPAAGALGASLHAAVETLAASLEDREEFRRRLSHEASHDALTQLPNRRAVMAHLHRSLARTRRSETRLAVMFIDLDGFKAVNDLEGHPAGDAVLRAVAQRLVGSMRDGDQVGRLGGDEFLVVAEPVTSADDAVGLAERLQTTLSAPIEAEGVSVSVSASIGVTVVESDSDLTADEVLRDADLAVYKAKSDGRARIAVCDDLLRAELDRRADIEHAVRTAIEDDQLAVHYQPIVDPGSGRLLALEALVRWHRPGVGLVTPDGFIPHAERSDLIVDIDRWVIDAVAAQLGAWEGHPMLGGIPVAVNISGRHLGRADFAEGVLERLYRRGASPRQLIVEVTESALLHDLDRAASRLQQLRDRGVRVSIDDFGTGYTSLAHLRTLPIDILKIDRSFTADTTAASLVKLIIDTGHLLGARITAEGIETAEQASSLAALGSDELQGYLYGRPVPADELAGLTSAELPDRLPST